MTFEALPWILLGVTILILIAALIALLISDRAEDKALAEIARLRQQHRIDRADLHEARKDVHRARGERDLARDTVRNLLDLHRHPGLRLSRTQPLPMPPDVDDELTTEFNKIVGRHWRPDTTA